MRNLGTLPYIPVLSYGKPSYIRDINQGYLTSSGENCSTEYNPLITSILAIDWILQCPKIVNRLFLD
jgi:hypothetical protein